MSPLHPAVREWHDSNPSWLNIAEYQTGDVLLELDDGTLAYGSQRDNGSWVQFVGGVTLRLCGPQTADDEDDVIGLRLCGPQTADDEDDVIGHLTRPREPVRFCVVPDDIAIHFMAH